MGKLTTGALTLLVCLWASIAHPQQAETLKQALAQGEASIELRYRYEFVDDGAFDLNAHASTLRTAIGYRTLPFKGFSLFLSQLNMSFESARQSCPQLA